MGFIGTLVSLEQASTAGKRLVTMEVAPLIKAPIRSSLLMKHLKSLHLITPSLVPILLRSPAKDFKDFSRRSLTPIGKSKN